MIRWPALLGMTLAALLPTTSFSHELDQAAETFLDALSESERNDALWPFDDDERMDVHYAPIGLDGLRHGDLNPARFEAGERVLAAALSDRGLARVHQVRELEAVLEAQESFLMNLTGLRATGRYFWAFFGDPGPDAPWAFRYEGHHLSLNVTVTPAGVATTPLFIGAQPRVVPEGLSDELLPAGTAVLGEEERLARELYAALDPAQHDRATLEYRDDRGHMIGQVARITAPDPVGLPRRDMNDAQRELLDALLERLAGLWTDPVAQARRDDIDAARPGLHFAHVESDEPPNAFYTRVSAPSLLIEIDNTEGGDHVHAVWHQPEGDFGDDLLARHLAEHHGIELARGPHP